MKIIALAGVILALAAGSLLEAAEPTAPGLPRSTPESQGVSSAGLLAFVEALDQQVDGMHGIVVVRHGQVVLEGWWQPYAAETPHSLYSLSKSFTSTAVGLAISEGKLSLDDPILKFFPDDAPSDPGKNLKLMRVSDLLRMSTGHQAEPKVGATDTQPWTKTFLAQPVLSKPGSHFLYNTPATYMLSAIVQKVTGQTVLDYLRPRIFDPLGIKDPTWGTSPQGISQGGFGLSIRTEDIAKFGQLYLRKGTWNGKQLVPTAWVEAATARQTSNGSAPDSDWDQGYGYQFWRSRHNAYRGDGAFGQYCVVIPEQDTVVAITSGVKDMQALINVVWDHLLPALRVVPIPADSSAEAQLKAKLAGLTIPPVAGKTATDLAKKVAGKRYAFPANPTKIEAVTWQPAPSGEANALILRLDGKDQLMLCDTQGWHKTRAALGPLAEQPASASAAWTSDDTLTTRIAFVETPFVATLKLKFTESEVTIDTESNVGFGATKQPSLVGKTE